ncbi:MAG: hypothetical protein H8E55_17080 [Pelagibacterales bacterium]|nr:hypothetical protein [Pelagibacterales bacterium]
MKAIDLQTIGKYLRENDMKPSEALEIIKKSVEINPNNQRSVWKAMRMQMYIQERLEEHKKGLLGKKAETVRRVIRKGNYQRLAETFNERPERAFKNFNHLITDPRQQHFFKVKNFKIKGLTNDLLTTIK